MFSYSDSAKDRLFLLSKMFLLKNYEHLAALGAVVDDALVGVGAAVEAVAGIEGGLAVVSGDLHLAGDDVVQALLGVGAELAAAAGQEVAQADGHSAVVNVLGIMQTGGANVEVLGSSVNIGLVLFGDLVAHGNTSFQKTLY